MRPDLLPLLPRFKPVISKRAGVALGLWGEPGIGKTHAVGQLLRQLQCQSLSLHATVSLAQLVKTLPQSNRLDSWAERILERLAGGEHLASANAADAIGALLGKLAPLVLHLEDLHEASPERVELVQRLAQIALSTKGLGLLVTSRGELPAPIKGIRLEALSPEAARALLESQAAAPLPPEVQAWIFERARGNPLFTTEYFRHLSRAGNLWSDGQRWHWRSPQGQSMPLTIEALLEQQILSVATQPEIAHALQAKALLTVNASHERWAEVAGLSSQELETARHRLQQQGILQNSDFAHPLFREVARSGIPAGQKQTLARRVLEVLQSEFPQEAAGFLPDANLNAPCALALLQQAANQSQTQHDEVGAARWWAKAVAYAEGEERGQLALRAAKVLHQYDLGLAIRLGQIAIGFPALVDEALPLLGLLLARQEDIAGLEQLLASPSAKGSGLNINALRLQAHQLSARHAAVVELWEQDPTLPQANQPEVLYPVAISYLALGNTEQSRAILNQALELPLSPAQRRDFVGIGAIIHLNQASYKESALLFEQSIQGLREAGDRRKLGAMLHNLSIVYKEMLDYPKAQRTLQEALDLRREMGDSRAYAHSLALMTELMIELGQTAQAEAAIEESLGILQLYPASHFLTNAHSQASYIYACQHTPLSGLLQLKHATRAHQYARQLNNPRLEQETAYDYALAQVRNANPQAGLVAAEQVLALAPKVGDPPNYRWRAHHARALALESLGDTQAALSELRIAEAVASNIPDHLNLHKLGLELARLTTDHQAAQTHRAWFVAKGLQGGANLVERYFPQLEEKGDQEPGAREINTRPPSRADQPSHDSHSQPPVLGVLGPMQLENDNQTKPMRGQKRQELLALLLEARMAGRSEVSKIELLEALYPGEDELKANTALKSAVHEVRSTFSASLIQTSPQGYALGPVQTDAEAFLQTADTALWRGAYLGGLGLESGARDSLYLALFSQAELRLASDPKEAARLGRILIEAEPYEARYLGLCLAALRAANNHKSLTRLYREAQERFAEVGQGLPEAWTDFLLTLG